MTEAKPVAGWMHKLGAALGVAPEATSDRRRKLRRAKVRTRIETADAVCGWCGSAGEPVPGQVWRVRRGGPEMTEAKPVAGWMDKLGAALGVIPEATSAVRRKHRRAKVRA